MMKGRLFIDDLDAYDEYGIYVVEGGWNELVAFPPLKAVKYNDWQEEDGEQCDLSAPVLNTHEVTIKFAVRGNDAISAYETFLTALGTGIYHEFTCTSIGRSFSLRLVSHSSLDIANRLGFLSVKFADDFPLRDYTYVAPISTVIQASDYKLDGTNLSQYGVRVLKGSLSEVLKGSSVKPAMLRNIPSQGGAIYDADAPVKLKGRDVKLTCNLRASTLSEFWRNYNALLYDLTKPNTRSLYVAATGQSYPFYYKSGAVSDFHPRGFGKVWLDFTLTLHFTLQATPEDND